MFGYVNLIAALKNGTCSKISVEGKEYLLSEARDFKQTSSGCSGILCNKLAFELKLTETKITSMK